jgi:hypothetical protein
VRGVPAVEHEDVAALERVEHACEVFALARLVPIEFEIDGAALADVDEQAVQRLWAVRSLGRAEGVSQLLGAIDIHFAAVDGEHAPTTPALAVTCAPQLGVERPQQIAKHFVRQARARVADRRSRHWARRRKRRAARRALLPEFLQQPIHAATCAVADHEEQERDEKLGRDCAIARERAAAGSNSRVRDLIDQFAERRVNNFTRRRALLKGGDDLPCWRLCV